MIFRRLLSKQYFLSVLKLFQTSKEIFMSKLSDEFGNSYGSMLDMNIMTPNVTTILFITVINLWLGYQYINPFVYCPSPFGDMTL